MPRRSRFIAPYSALVELLGRNAFERYSERIDGETRSRRHIGWRWPCDCLAFARAEGDYLLVPCNRHDGATASERPQLVATQFRSDEVS